MPGINRVTDAKARWLGHALHADVTIAVDERLPLAKANMISASLQKELFAHMPALAVANVRFDMTADPATTAPAQDHRHAPRPFRRNG